MARPLVIILAALLAGGSPAAALSAETAEERDTRLKKAQAYLDLATTLFGDKDFAGALKELQRAEPLLEGSDVLPLVRFNIARCFEEMGRPADAVRAYQRYLTLSEEADRRRDRAREAVRLLEPKAVGGLTIECAQKGTLLRIDGLEQPNRTCPVQVKGVLGGSYPTVAAAEGFREARQTIIVEPGRMTTHRFDLTPEADPTLREVQTTTRSTEGRSALPWIIVGAGVGAAATGAVFHVMAADTLSTLNKTAKESPGYDSLESEYEGQRLTTFVTYGVGAALIGAGLYLWFRGDGDPADQAFVPTPNGVMVRF